MSLSGAQLTRLGAGGPGRAYAGFSAKVEGVAAYSETFGINSLISPTQGINSGIEITYGTNSEIADTHGIDSAISGTFGIEST